MNDRSTQTEAVVRSHLRAFLEQKGLDAIVADYHDQACLLNDTDSYLGKPAIRRFFEGFVASLPRDAITGFTLHCLRAEGETAFITWSAGSEIPLGTDTFLVRAGQIVAQTFAAYRAPAR